MGVLRKLDYFSRVYNKYYFWMVCVKCALPRIYDPHSIRYIEEGSGIDVTLYPEGELKKYEVGKWEF